MKREDEKVLDRFRGAGRCQYCYRISGAPHAAHVFARGAGGGGRLDIALNLVSLCGHCHAESHAGREPTRADLLRAVALRHGLTPEEVGDVILVYRRAP